MGEFTINWNDIIKWSGWAIAIGLVSYEFIKWLRFRIIIKIEISTFKATEKDNTTKYLAVTVKNDGRRPTNVINIGFILSNDERYPFNKPYYRSPETLTELDGFFPSIEVEYPSFWLYKKRPRNYNFSYTVLRKVTEKYNASITKIFVVEETGDEHTEAIPDKIRQELNG